MYVCMYVCIYVLVRLTGLPRRFLSSNVSTRSVFQMRDLSDTLTSVRNVYVCMYVCKYVYLNEWRSDRV